MFEFWKRIKVADPLDEETGWKLPETARQGPFLTLLGGKTDSFIAVSELFSVVSTLKTVRGFAVMLPESLKQAVGSLDQAVYLKSNSLGVLKAGENANSVAEYFSKADRVIVSEDLLYSSESSVILRNALIANGKFVLQGSAVGVFAQDERVLLDMPQAVVLVTVEQLQDLMVRAQAPIAVKQSFGLLELVRYLSEVSRGLEASFIVSHADAIVVARKGDVVSIDFSDDNRMQGWRSRVCAHVAYMAGVGVVGPLESVVYGCHVALKEAQ